MSKQIIFIGDSITECGLREYPEQIGNGYVRILHDYLKTTYPAKQLNIVNQGVSGNRITDLDSRWETDVIALNPDIISISIGINDVWRQLDQPEMEQVYPEQFEQIYYDLLSEVKAKTNAAIILIEPTVIEEYVHSEGNTKLIPYVNIIHKLAKEFQAIVVPTHKAFIDYLQTTNEYKLTIDGVHMNSAGNMLMAVSWLKGTKDLLDRKLENI